MQEGMEGNPVAGTMKNVFVVLSAHPIPITSTFPKVMLFSYCMVSFPNSR
ncbi:hypothetical protein SLEP1_g53502 [Rubroshorea leprosula]|uniref:Uncharacterized protein n=1 Tax=Rubroshorea leprosula TaxID=152421 RepID=A0AAV5MBZ3_9ROSI|nr:hypothetical protein SLEP1_g53502 [Rubroshorea leprosula]